jgi:hypothetical protein
MRSGDTMSDVCVMDAAGRTRRARVASTRKGMTNFFTREPAHVVIEVDGQVRRRRTFIIHLRSASGRGLAVTSVCEVRIDVEAHASSKDVVAPNRVPGEIESTVPALGEDTERQLDVNRRRRSAHTACSVGRRVRRSCTSSSGPAGDFASTDSSHRPSPTVVRNDAHRLDDDTTSEHTRAIGRSHPDQDLRRGCRESVGFHRRDRQPLRRSRASGSA